MGSCALIIIAALLGGIAAAPIHTRTETSTGGLLDSTLPSSLSLKDKFSNELPDIFGKLPGLKGAEE
jgi:hypothetical protein